MGILYSKESKQQLLDMLMQDIFHIHIKLGHKQGMYLIVMELLFHGDR